MSTDFQASVILSALLALGCAGNAVDLGHGQGRGWADAPAQNATAAGPQTVYESDDPIFGFALDGDTLYALVDHQNTFELVSCPLERCQSERTTWYSGQWLADDRPTLAKPALNAGSLYWIAAERGATGVAVCPTTGSGKPGFLPSLVNSSLAADPAGGVYWIDSEGWLVRGVSGSDTAERVRSLAGEIATPLQVSVQGDFVYFAGSDDDSSSIRRVRKDGTAPSQLIVVDDAIGGLSVDAEAIYYPSQILAGRIVACPLDDCRPSGSTLVSNQRWPAGIQVDRNEAFWLHGASEPTPRATLSSCGLPDCALVQERVSDFPTLIGFPRASLGSEFAVNERAVVWLEHYRDNGSRLRSLPR